MAIRPRHLLLFLPLLSGMLAAQPLFDAHLHYDASHARVYPPQQIIAILKDNNVGKGVVAGAPPLHALALHQQAPDLVLPFLGAYRSSADKATWHRDEALPARIEQRLKNDIWRGIGELHLFAEHRHSPVFRRIVDIAARHGLPLLIHADPAVIDTVFETTPDVTVIWAHAGTFPYPDLVDDYLDRYPRLYVDLSVRDERIAPGGMLRDAWYDLFLKHPDRCLVGVDTYSVNRWDRYHRVSERIRHWLSQLPHEVAERLAYRNAERLFERQRR
jgi:hypothetical protein